MDDYGRIAMAVIWAGVCLYGYGGTLVNRFHDFRMHDHDRRSRRELIAAGALFLVSLSSALSIVVLLLFEQGTGLRGLFAAVSLGAFAAAGLVMKGEKGTVPTNPENGA